MTDSRINDNKSQANSCCQPRLQSISSSPESAVKLPTEFPAARWIVGRISTSVGDIPVVATHLSFEDKLGSWKARWGIGRMSYRVEPRLYAVGHPTETSPVFVTANYKMSFDRLRSQLGGIDGWILVLDTKGINVWCAAGKGTFGTDEIVRRVEAVGLKKLVTHRRLILPQLGASGVSAHLVRERSDFRVVYGPVRAGDIKTFLQSGMRATPEMRQITFTLSERLVLIPADIAGSLRYAIPAAAAIFLLSGLGPGIYSLDRVMTYGVANAALVLIAALGGAVLPAVLLPWLPGRAFSVKGAWIGILLAVAIGATAWQNPSLFRGWLSAASWMFFIPAVVSFLSFNFTGSSTYTSLSGVKKEMRVAVPAQMSVAAAGLVLWTIGLFV